MRGHQFVTIASVVVAAASVAYAAGRAQATSQPVLVTNSSSQPVPASIPHSIALPAVQSGAWNVGQIGDKLPFVRFQELTTNAGQNVITDAFTVPSGLRLVIENFSVVSSPQFSGEGTLLGQITIFHSGALHEKAATIFSPQTTAETVANLQTRLTGEPGDTVGLTFLRSPNTVNGTDLNQYTLTGYFVTP